MNWVLNAVEYARTPSFGAPEDSAVFKRFALAAVLLAFSTLLPSQGAASPVPAAEAVIVAQASLPTLFSTEDAAQAHCPRDVVVWLNIPSGIYRKP